MSQEMKSNKAVRFRVKRPWVLIGILVGLGLACAVFVVLPSGYTGYCRTSTGPEFICSYSQYLSFSLSGWMILVTILLAVLLLTPIGWVIGGVVLLIFIRRQRAKYVESKKAAPLQAPDVGLEIEAAPPDSSQL